MFKKVKLKKASFAVVVLLGLVTIGCQLPGRRGCAGGSCSSGSCSGGSCGVSTPSGSGYSPTPSAYAPAPQPSYPPAGQGSGSR